MTHFSLFLSLRSHLKGGLCVPLLENETIRVKPTLREGVQVIFSNGSVSKFVVKQEAIMYLCLHGTCPSWELWKDILLVIDTTAESCEQFVWNDDVRSHL